MLRFLDEAGNDLGQGLLPLFDRSLVRNDTYARVLQSEALDHPILEEAKSIELEKDGHIPPIASKVSSGNSSGEYSRPDDAYFGLDLSSGGVRRGMATFDFRVSAAGVPQSSS